MVKPFRFKIKANLIIRTQSFEMLKEYFDCWFLDGRRMTIRTRLDPLFSTIKLPISSKADIYRQRSIREADFGIFIVVMSIIF